LLLPVPVAARSKTYVCGRSPAEGVRIPPGAWKFFCCECCVLSGRGLCDEVITRPEESYRLWCVVVWSRILKNEEAMTRVELQRHRGKKKYIYINSSSSSSSSRKVNFTLEQDTKAQRGYILLLYYSFNLGARCGWVVNSTPRPLYSREIPGTLCDWVGHRVGLDGCGKSRPHRNSIPGPSSP
jgi:hypothetical protein